jgi:hypothetical protein
VDSAGNIYLAGSVTFPLPGQSHLGAADAFLRKYRPDGAELWTRQFGTPVNDGATDVAADASGNIYVVVNTQRIIAGRIRNDGFVRKYGSGGNGLWTRQFAGVTGTSAYAVAADVSGNILVLGATYAATGSFNSSFVTKYDRNGAEIWTRQLGSGQVSDIAVDTMGSFYVTGTVDAAGFVRKHDANGIELWTRQFSSDRYFFVVNAVAADGSGNTFVTGWKSTFGEGNPDIFVRKYDTHGTELWSREGPSPSYIVPLALAVDTRGSIYAAGQLDSPGSLDGSLDAFVRQYSSSGTVFWTRRFDRPGDGSASAVAVNPDGDIYLAASTYSDLEGVSGFLVKLLHSAFIPGDVDGNGVVDCQDIAVARAAFGRAWDERADVVYDGRIDIRDLAFVAQRLAAGMRCR